MSTEFTMWNNLKTKLKHFQWEDCILKKLQEIDGFVYTKTACEPNESIANARWYGSVTISCSY